MNDTPITRRNVITGLAMMGAAGIAHARQPKPYAKKLPRGALETYIPQQIGDWRFETTSGVVLPPPDAYMDKIYDGGVLTRVYTRPNTMPVMLLIAYNSVQDGLLQLHRPEICYPVGGYALTKTEVSELAVMPGETIPVRSFTAASDSRVEQVMYWTRVGDVMPTSWRQQRWAVVEANLKGNIPDGVLVRISAVDLDMTASMKTLQSFAQAMAKSLKPGVRKLLWQSAA